MVVGQVGDARDPFNHGEATEMNDVVEQVTLRAFIECIGCSRKLDTSETLHGDSVRTGNHTQKASYWLDGMGQRIIGSAKARKWA